MKSLVIEGTVTMVSTRGVTVVGKEAGSEEEWTVQFKNKGNATFREVPLDAKVNLSVQMAETVADQ